MRRFVLEAQAPGRAWHAWHTGESIGHKRIWSFAPRPVLALRLRVTAAAVPRIRMLAVVP